MGVSSAPKLFRAQEMVVVGVRALEVFLEGHPQSSAREVPTETHILLTITPLVCCAHLFSYLPEPALTIFFFLFRLHWFIRRSIVVPLFSVFCYHHQANSMNNQVLSYK